MSVTDLLYLDRPRARRVLGEVDGGVVERVVSSVASRRSGHLKAKVPGLLEGGGDVGGDSRVEETLSTDDALLSVLEGTLEQAGLLADGGDLSEPRAWEQGLVHGRFKAADLVRVTCAAQLLDPEFFSSSVNRVVDALETMAIFSAGPTAMGKSANERAKIAKHSVKDLMGGMAPDLVRQLGSAIERFFGQGLFIRQLPCGTNHRAYALLGTLRTDVGTLLDDRSAMFAKYGAAPSEWTVLSQIASVTEPTVEEAPSLDEDEGLDRAGFERIAGDMMVALESSGLSGGPVWPTITVSPIAVYRSARALVESSERTAS